MNVYTYFENKPLLFHEPEFIISCDTSESFSRCFQEMEQAVAHGYYLAGFFSYEAGYYFEECLRENKTSGFPLICFGAYKAPLCKSVFTSRHRVLNPLKNLRINISQERYFKNIQAIRDYIALGDVYQITYCIKLLFDFCGDPLSFFKALLREQPVPYPAYLETDQFRILSLSPEMFVKKTGSHVVTKPMKGTWPRADSIILDAIGRVCFQYDEKNRAENVMIADLLRNDLGRIGTHIRAPRLFEVAKYKTLFQMTSTVTGKVEEDISFYALFASLFPSGSVTGAPKIRAMQIIRELEQNERKIYTGAIGYITPKRDLFFNIPIRTLLLKGNSGEMGIGGGIVWDSTPQGEWDEGMLKAKFVTEREQ